VARRAKKSVDAVQELLDDCETVPEDLMECLERLRDFSRPYLELLDQRLHQHGEDFLRGLLSDMERKSTEPIAESVGKDRFPLQHFIGRSPWDYRPLLDELCGQVAQELGEPNGILVIDPSAFPKKGKESVGVGRQWCGRLGKVDNCQVGVYLGYKSNKGHTLVDERLYLPKSWTRDASRRAKCRVPKSVRFRTATQLAVELLRERRSRLPHGWVVADDEFGRPGGFRKQLRRMGERYVLDIPSNILVRDLQAPAPKRKHKRGRAPKTQFVTCATWKDGVGERGWERIHVRDGTKGPLVILAVRARVQTRGSKGPEWLVVTKTDSETPEYQYHLSNADETVSLKELVQVSNARYWIEDCFERGKGKVGLDHYEVRSWDGWHHHMTLCLMALFFLVLEQRRLNRKTPAMTVQQSAEAIGEILVAPNIDLRKLALKITRRLRRMEQTRIDHWRKFKRLPPTWPVARSFHVPNVQL
jgi:SRSO17 transposase